MAAAPDRRAHLEPLLSRRTTSEEAPPTGRQLVVVQDGPPGHPYAIRDALTGELVAARAHMTTAILASWSLEQGQPVPLLAC